MVNREHAQRLWNNLLELGAGRLTALALVGLAVFLGVGGGAYYLSRPEFDVLYTGLTREDVTRVGSVLRDASISFDVNCRGRHHPCTTGADRAGANPARRQGVAQQHQRRIRAVRQDRLARSHFIHAGGHPGPCARRRDCPYHPGDQRRQSRARSHRRAGAGIVPARAAATFGIRRHPNRWPRGGPHGAFGSLSRRGGSPRNDP